MNYTVLNTIELLHRINPRHGDKYSTNLHRWVEAWVRHHRCTGMEYPEVFSLANWKNSASVLIIGKVLPGAGLSIGAVLNTVLSYGEKAQTFGQDRNRMTPVYGFWEEYIRDGCCAVDREHRQIWLKESTRWTTADNVRHCNWCGNHTQTLLTWTEEKHCHEWVPA